MNQVAGGFRHILLPIDGSACSDRALDEAIALALHTQARLTVMHMVEPLAYVTSFESAMNAVAEVRPLMREAGQRLVAHAAARAMGRGVSADAALVVPAQGHQRLWEAVAELALACAADLIVIGSHGRKGASRALLGSDAEQIIRHSRLPVLVIKGEGRGQPS